MMTSTAQTDSLTTLFDIIDINDGEADIPFDDEPFVSEKKELAIHRMYCRL